jgi:hypothetical protein
MSLPFHANSFGLTVRVKHTYLPKLFYNFINRHLGVLRCGHRYRRGRIFEAKFCLGRGRSRDPPDPQKPRFWACQKVVPPPCKNVQKMAFLGEKACIFGQFVHNFAQKWPLFCGHSPPLQGCQSVGKKPANLYSTKCRIFGPRTPPPVAPWWDTSSRRPPTGSRRPFFQNPKNRTFPKHDDGDRISPMTLFLYL